MNNSKITPLNIFIATSITNKLTRPKEIAKLRCLVETIERTAAKNSSITLCAFHQEGWAGEENPEVYVPRDYGWCKACNGAIILPELSYGVRIEEGWLTAFHKPMLRLHEKAVCHQSHMEEHLCQVAAVFDRSFTGPLDIGRHVDEFIRFLRR
ncbi:hypothetical protein JXA56_05940 [Candidatus Micrarchaeota archaeon]|nr:hypothetical protein [Candidatus Micrarchaeota archaeon]